MGQSRMYNPENLATLGTQDTIQNKKYNTACVGHHYAQTRSKGRTRILHVIVYFHL
jgi:hypothetical protein